MDRLAVPRGVGRNQFRARAITGDIGSIALSQTEPGGHHRFSDPCLCQLIPGPVALFFMVQYCGLRRKMYNQSGRGHALRGSAAQK
jgi:hypothetical protein